MLGEFGVRWENDNKVSLFFLLSFPFIAKRRRTGRLSILCGERAGTVLFFLVNDRDVNGFVISFPIFPIAKFSSCSVCYRYLIKTKKRGGLVRQAMTQISDCACFDLLCPG